MVRSRPVSIIKKTPTKVFRGPEGHRGSQGERGLPGESVTGPQGERGLKGESVTGPQGERGLKGDKGESGDSVVGPRGSKGKQGEAGKRGERGLRGFKGEKGKQGKDAEKFSIERLSKVELSRLKDKLKTTTVSDITLSDSIQEPVLTVKYTDGSEKKLVIDNTSTIAITNPRQQTNITEEVLSPEDSANLATTAEKLEELVRNQQCQLNTLDKELKQIKTHMSLMTDEEITEKDVQNDY